MRSTIFRCVCASLCLCCLLCASTAYTGMLADRKLLQILESKGMLSEAEAGAVRTLIAQEERSAEQAQLALTRALDRDVEIVFDNGFEIRTRDQTTFSARLGMTLQTDFLLFDSDYPVENDFDIRRARVVLQGRFLRDFAYKLEFELEGSSSDRLVDGWLEYARFDALRLRVGQFKEPFSLEQLTSDKWLAFNERSFCYYLTPGRDVGLMLHGRLWGQTLLYGVGVFNGDGRDADRRGQKDDKQVTGRVALRPFAQWGPRWLSGLHFGGSYSYARMDTSDFYYAIRTPGRTTFFTVQPRAKFHMTRKVDDVTRWGAEAAFALGPMLLSGEFVHNGIDGVKLADTTTFDFDMYAWYASALVMLTGERPRINNGIIQPIHPRSPFIWGQGWGAWGIAVRYQGFHADPIVYDSLVNQGYSVRSARCWTVALNWYLNALVRITFDYSRTRFDDSLFLGTSMDGSAYYRDTEDVFTTRVQVAF